MGQPANLLACTPTRKQGHLAWSNELALHVIELNTNGPASQLAKLPAQFHADIQRINRRLATFGGMLMPTAMHPWMDPHTETRLWPHEYNPIYEAYNRIFDCRGHGWANLQSTHINLPFADDTEFERLHAAIRLILPILPTLAASSPFADGRFTGYMDMRLEAYRNNANRIPQITGHVIPETVSSHDEYSRLILLPMYAAIAPHDPAGTLHHEWLNSRGAIARFDRNTIEIRVLDTQECPRADLAIAAITVAALKMLVEERASDLAMQKTPRTEQLAAIFLDTIRNGSSAQISDHDYLNALGIADTSPCPASALWSRLIERAPLDNPDVFLPPLEIILDHGCLAERIVHAMGCDISHERLDSIWRKLCHCLAEDTLFIA